MNFEPVARYEMRLSMANYHVWDTYDNRFISINEVVDRLNARETVREA